MLSKLINQSFSVPEEDPSGQTTILSYVEFQRIRNAARVLTKEERQRVQDEARDKIEEVQVCMVSQVLKFTTLSHKTIIIKSVAICCAIKIHSWYIAQLYTFIPTSFY